MRNPLLVPELRELIKSENKNELQFFLDDMHPAVASEFLSALDTDEIIMILTWLEPNLAADIFTNFEIEDQEFIVKRAALKDISPVLNLMPPDDRADLFKEISAEERERVLPALAKAEREDIRRLAAFKEGSAGSCMTSDYAILMPSLTVGQAIDKLRAEAPNRETIYYAYCIDETRRLIGFVSLKDIILANPDVKISDIMHTEVISVRADEDQEEAARTIQKYDLIAVPVTNNEGVLVGIITHDDALDIITQEHTEDIEKLMAISGDHGADPYLKTSSMEHFKKRSIWVVGLAVVGLGSGMVIHSAEDTLAQLMVLTFYMPMIADAGGNTGSQASTVVIRALALKEIEPSDIFKVLFKELKIGLLLGLVLAVVSFGKVLFLSSQATLPEQFTLVNIAFVISMSLGMQVVSATLIGTVLPLVAKKMNQDPAVVASPALTTLVDVTGLLIYFNTARFLLGL